MSDSNEQPDSVEASASPHCYAVRLEIWFSNSGPATRVVQMPILPVGSLIDVDGGDPYSIKYWRFDADDGEISCVLHFVGDHDYGSEPEDDETRQMLIDAGFEF